MWCSSGIITKENILETILQMRTKTDRTGMIVLICIYTYGCMFLVPIVFPFHLFATAGHRTGEYVQEYGDIAAVAQNTNEDDSIRIDMESQAGNGIDSGTNSMSIMHTVHASCNTCISIDCANATSCSSKPECELLNLNSSPVLLHSTFL